MQITFHFAQMSNEFLIDMANAVSRELDRPVVFEPMELELQFKALCNELTRRNVEVADFVICPTYNL